MRAANLTCSILLILVMGISASITTAQTGNAASPPPLGKLIDVGGYRVHLYCTGTGRPPRHHRWCGIFIRLGPHSARSREVHPGLHV